MTSSAVLMIKKSMPGMYRQPSFLKNPQSIFTVVILLHG
jgi:hypothetical protein